MSGYYKFYADSAVMFLYSWYFPNCHDRSEQKKINLVAFHEIFYLKDIIRLGPARFYFTGPKKRVFAQCTGKFLLHLF